MRAGEAPSLQAVDATGREMGELSFGQWVATYGYYALDLGQVNQAAFAARIPRLAAITTTRDYMAYPDEKRRMMALALGNVTHFSAKALEAYLRNHDLALRNAASADDVWLVPHYEALALHSLTDLFAPGHMLDDRELTNQLVSGTHSETHTHSGILSHLLLSRTVPISSSFLGERTNDYHSAYNYEGAMARNLKGQQWRAHGDGRLSASAPNLAMGMAAATDSLTQVMQTALGAPPPAVRQAAVRYLPVEFWDTHAPIAPQDQFGAVAALVIAQQRGNLPVLDYGFDFGLNILLFNPAEMKGAVGYRNLPVSALQAGSPQRTPWNARRVALHWSFTEFERVGRRAARPGPRLMRWTPASEIEAPYETTIKLVPMAPLNRIGDQTNRGESHLVASIGLFSSPLTTMIGIGHRFVFLDIPSGRSIDPEIVSPRRSPRYAPYAGLRTG